MPDAPGAEPEVPIEPGSAGVAGEHPNRSDDGPGGEPAALDEHPDGMSPMQSDEDHHR